MRKTVAQIALQWNELRLDKNKPISWGWTEELFKRQLFSQKGDLKCDNSGGDLMGSGGCGFDRWGNWEEISMAGFSHMLRSNVSYGDDGLVWLQMRYGIHCYWKYRQKWKLEVRWESPLKCVSVRSSETPGCNSENQTEISKRLTTTGKGIDGRLTHYRIQREEMSYDPFELL